MDRRTFLTRSLAGGFLAPGGFSAAWAMGNAGIAIEPFAHSPTVTNFAATLLLFSDRTRAPFALRRALEVELERTRGPLEAEPQERKRAALFARLAVWNIAPRALRRAGYDALATECENEPSFRPGDAEVVAAGAQHTIGKQYPGGFPPPPPMPRRAHRAYSACAHASTTAFYAGLDDIEVVYETGSYCARALAGSCFCDDEIEPDCCRRLKTDPLL